MDDETIDEFKDRVTRYYGRDFDQAFEGIKADFFVASPEQRVQWLRGYDNAIGLETRPSQDLAEMISKKRELHDIHNLLLRARR